MQINKLQRHKNADEKPVKQSALDLQLLPYPLLHRYARSASRFDEAVEEVRAGVAAGSIRNAVLQDAMAVLSHAVNDAWQRLVDEPYFHAESWQALPAEVQALC